MARNDDPADYAVGRGKPPRSSQFKPGQSGNPGGRKKGSRNLRTILDAVMNTEVELTENGRKRKVPVIEAIILRQVQEALRGHTRAAENLIDRYERHGDRDTGAAEELPEDDLALLERAFSARAQVGRPDEGEIES